MTIDIFHYNFLDSTKNLNRIIKSSNLTGFNLIINVINNTRVIDLELLDQLWDIYKSQEILNYFKSDEFLEKSFTIFSFIDNNKMSIKTLYELAYDANFYDITNQLLFDDPYSDLDSSINLMLNAFKNNYFPCANKTFLEYFNNINKKYFDYNKFIICDYGLAYTTKKLIDNTIKKWIKNKEKDLVKSLESGKNE